MDKISKFTIARMAFLTSFASMVYELVIAQALAVLTDEHVLWESLSIGIFVASTGLGIFLFEKMRKSELISFFMQAEAMLAFVGGLSLFFIFFIHIVYRIYIADYQNHEPFFKPLNWIILACQSPNILIGILSGMELRVLFEFLEKESDSRSQIFVLAIYHFGALCASLSFGTFVQWKWDPYYLSYFASMLNMGIFLWCVWKVYPRKFIGFSFVLSSLSVVYLCVPTLWGYMKDIQLKNFYYNEIQVHSENGVLKQVGPVPLNKLLSWSAQVPEVKRMRSHFQVIDWMPKIGNEKHWYLYLDGHLQFATEMERTYHEALAHVPIMVTEKVPEKVLVLGGGDGLLLRELKKYGKRLSSLDLVELDREMISLGKSEPLSTLNENALDHPSVHVHIADAFAWLRVRESNFDAIYLDFPYPYTFEGLRIYSSEFFSLAARHMSEDAFLVMDIPLFRAGDVHWKSHVGSLLAKAGFKKVLAFEGENAESFILARKKGESLNFAFRDMGVPLQVLDAHWFESVENVADLSDSSFQDLNSVLKPRRIAVSDGWK